MCEVFKKCFESYEISNFGNLRRLKKNGEYIKVKGSILNTGSGYRYFQINRKGKRLNNLFHHLVAEVFIGKRPTGLVVDHIDRNSLNNNVKNLRYITQLENMRNTSRYRDDIKETCPKKRERILLLERRKKIYDEKMYPCNLCELYFQSDGKLERHLNGRSHLLKNKCFEELGEDWRLNYKSWKSKRNDKKRDKDKRKEYDKKYSKKYYIENREEIIEKNKKWREVNKERIKEYDKKWRECNKEKVKQISKKYREANKEKLRKKQKENYKEKISEQRKKEKYKCACGSDIRMDNKNRHQKSKKHQTYITNQNLNISNSSNCTFNITINNQI